MAKIACSYTITTNLIDKFLHFADTEAAENAWAGRARSPDTGGLEGRAWWPGSALNRGPFFLSVSELSTWVGSSR